MRKIMLRMKNMRIALLLSDVGAPLTCVSDKSKTGLCRGSCGHSYLLFDTHVNGFA